jgi:hypothetical protein
VVCPLPFLEENSSLLFLKKKKTAETEVVAVIDRSFSSNF